MWWKKSCKFFCLYIYWENKTVLRELETMDVSTWLEAEYWFWDQQGVTLQQECLAALPTSSTPKTTSESMNLLFFLIKTG